MILRRRFLAGVALLATAPLAALGTTPADDARAVLDKPFHFLLRLPRWPVVHAFAHESDLFSVWGYLVLERGAKDVSRNDTGKASVLQAARAAGWSAVHPSDDAEAPDLRRYGINAGRECMALRRSIEGPGQNPPTRYLLRVWCSADGTRMVALFRVDGE